MSEFFAILFMVITVITGHQGQIVEFTPQPDTVAVEVILYRMPDSTEPYEVTALIDNEIPIQCDAPTVNEDGMQFCESSGLLPAHRISVDVYSHEDWMIAFAEMKPMKTVFLPMVTK